MPVIVLLILLFENNKSIVAAPITTQQIKRIEQSLSRLVSSSREILIDLLSSDKLLMYLSRSIGNKPYAILNASHTIDLKIHLINSPKVRFMEGCGSLGLPYKLHTTAKG